MRRMRVDVVFYLNSEPGTEEIRIGNDALRNVVITGSASPSGVLQAVVDVMRQFDMPMEFRSRNGRFSACTYLEKVADTNEWRGEIEAGQMLFHFSHLPNLRLSFLTIKELTPGAARSWDAWVQPFLRDERFVQALVSDVEYDYWQNAKDPLQYKAAGRSYEHLPMISNGLPPPVEQLQIDTSRNPGRRTFKSGYIEAVGAAMWLAEPFWKLVGEHRKKMLHFSNEIGCTELGNGVIKVVAATDFCDTSTESMQNDLRRILFDL